MKISYICLFALATFFIGDSCRSQDNEGLGSLSEIDRLFLVTEILKSKSEEEFGDVLGLTPDQKKKFDSIVKRHSSRLSEHSNKKTLSIHEIEKSTHDPQVRIERIASREAEYSKVSTKIYGELLHDIDDVIVEKQWLRVRQLSTQRRIRLSWNCDEIESVVYAGREVGLSSGDVKQLKEDSVKAKQWLNLQLEKLDSATRRKISQNLSPSEVKAAEILVGSLDGKIRPDESGVKRGRETLNDDAESAFSLMFVFLNKLKKSKLIEAVGLTNEQWGEISKLAYQSNREMLFEVKEAMKKNKAQDDIFSNKSRKPNTKALEKIKKSIYADFVADVEPVLLPHQIRLLKQYSTREYLNRKSKSDIFKYHLGLFKKMDLTTNRFRSLEKSFATEESIYREKVRRLKRQATKMLFNDIREDSKAKIEQLIGEIRFDN